MKAPPDESGKGRWISVVGLMQPPYSNPRYNYSHLSVSVDAGTQLALLSENEAKFRLGGSATRTAPPQKAENKRPSNADVLKDMPKRSTGPRVVRTSKKSSAPVRPVPVRSQNQAVLDRMKAQRPVSPTQPLPPRGTLTPRPTSETPEPTSSSKCFVATAIYGADSPKTHILRAWRDQVFLPTVMGRWLVVLYYSVSPHVVPLLARSLLLRNTIERTLDYIVQRVGREDP